MLRWLLVTLMFVLPTQFIWAAVAPYCAHEVAPASFHVGHHAHQHHSGSPGSSDTPASADAADQADRPAGAATVEHPDCGQCHASHAQFGLARPMPWAAPLAGRFAGPSPEPYRSRIEPNIDRPKWTLAA